MPLNRRDFLTLLGTGTGAMTVGSLVERNQVFSMPFEDITPESAKTSVTAKGLSFRPVRGPMPLHTDGVTAPQQANQYSRYTVVDDLVLPEGFGYAVVAAWGDRVGDSRFGYNNDYLSFVATGKDEGYLTINFEYISAIPWLQTYEQVIGKTLPFNDVTTAIKANGSQGINAYTLPETEPLKAQIRTICQEALLDQGMGVISIRKTASGKWERTYSKADRRISGISGLTDGNYLKATGPATVIFRKTTGQGYRDRLGDRIIGTFANCAGGTTPWGTVLSAEENYQTQVPDAIYADGTPMAPGDRPFTIDAEEVSGQGNVLGLAGNKYGWIVEVDPANPKDYGTKHTWMGRFRHEAVGIRVVAGKPLAFYSGCDRRGGHVYKFISRDPVSNPKVKANSRLLEHGMLYAAKFNPDGTGRWLALRPDTAVEPDLPGAIAGNLLMLPNRPQGGYFKATTDAQVTAFKQQFKTLADLYDGTPQEKQGAILIDAHYAANAIGATCTARPEDTEIAPDGSLYIAFTSAAPGSDGGADARIFKGPDGKPGYEFGCIMHLTEDKNDPTAMTFRWKILALGGEPGGGGAGFSNPDNLLLDRSGNVWMVNDMSSDKLNRAVSSRTDAEGKAISQSNLRGVFGNNAIWFIPTAGKNAGKPYLFGIGPMECETTGPFFTPDQRTLFLSIQHPGEVNGIRKNRASVTRQFLMKTTDGKEFSQSREVPVGSNWPGKGANDPPKPSVVAIYRLDQGEV